MSLKALVYTIYYNNHIVLLSIFYDIFYELMSWTFLVLIGFGTCFDSI